jgi:hypothetical protein
MYVRAGVGSSTAKVERAATSMASALEYVSKYETTPVIAGMRKSISAIHDPAWM